MSASTMCFWNCDWGPSLSSVTTSLGVSWAQRSRCCRYSLVAILLEPVRDTELVLNGAEKAGLLLSGRAARVEDNENLDHGDCLWCV